MTNNDKVVFSSSNVELSEFKTYIELTSRLCWYGYPNANGALLPVEGAEDKAQTLIHQPVVAYYKKDRLGRDDLGGHQMSVDDDANDHHGTESIGVNTSVEVREDTVEITGEEVTTPCLFATRRIWTRYKNYVNAIKRLHKANKLTSSWEILVSSYTYKDGVRILEDYCFDADALLGSQVTPAFSCATTLSVAETDPDEMLLAEALASDINPDKEENTMADTVTTPMPQEEEVKTPDQEVPAQDNPAQENPVEEQSALTEWDLRRRIAAACAQKSGKYCWISFHFPADKIVWAEYDGRASELDYYAFTYEVENDVVTVSDPEAVKLTVAPVQINEVLSEKDKELSAKEEEISQKNDSLMKANERVKELEEEVSALTPFKEAHEQAERARIEAENAEKRKALSERLTKSGLFTEEEMASEEIKALIENMDEPAIKAQIADRFMASLDEPKPETEEKKPETAEARPNLEDDPAPKKEYSLLEVLSM